MPGEGLTSAHPFQLTGLKPFSGALSPRHAIDSPAASMVGGSMPLFLQVSPMLWAHLEPEGIRVK